jgi:hypothetical protein
MTTAETHKKVDLEYEQINENIRFLADVRFKLLALVPTLGGAAIFILAQHVGLQADDVASPSPPKLLTVAVIGLLGFLATLGITLYDQRNSELYNALIHRAKHLEKQFETSSTPGGLRISAHGGQYSERPKKYRRIIFKAGHDFGLALIYGPILGAWLFPVSYAAGRIAKVEHDYALPASVVLAGLGAAIFAAWLVALDKHDSEMYNAAAKRDGLEQTDSANTEGTMSERKAPESFKTYEDGKHRRYQLLFSVNGGAFAVAKLLGDKDLSGIAGHLTLSRLSIGMLLFTLVMVTDIFAFGEKMRKFMGGNEKPPPDSLGVFGPPGKVVLLLLGALICAGWILIGYK